MFKRKNHNLSGVEVLAGQAWSYYKANFKTLMLLVLTTVLVVIGFYVGVTCFAVMVTMIGAASAGKMSLGVAWSVGITLLALGVAIIAYSIITCFILQTAMTWAILKEDTKKGLRELWRIGKENYKKVAITTIFSALMIIGWMLLLIIPGIIMSVYYTFAIWICLDSGKSGREAIAASKSLVKGRWWPVAWRAMLPQAILVLAAYILAICFTGKFSFNDDPTFNNIYNIASFFAAPFMVAYAGALYRDAKKSR